MKNQKLFGGGVMLGGLCLLLFGAWLDAGSSPTLARLERAARAIDYRQSGYHHYGGNDRYWQVKQLEITGGLFLGVTILYAAPHYGAVGTASPSTRQIVVDDTLTWNERLEVLAHELAHMLQPRTLTQGQGEVFAEGVGYLVCQRLGHDRLEVHARYLAAHKPSLHVLTDYAQELHWAANVLAP